MSIKRVWEIVNVTEAEEHSYAVLYGLKEEITFLVNCFFSNKLLDLAAYFIVRFPHPELEHKQYIVVVCYQIGELSKFSQKIVKNSWEWSKIVEKMVKNSQK